MKVAIYGDSFADPLSGPSHLHSRAWSRQLESHHLVRNYSISGSSLYHQVSQFEQNYSWADRVIFIVTGFGRWPGTLRHNGRAITLPSAGQCSYHLDQHLYPHEITRTITAVRDWFMWGQVDPFERYIHDLMIERIYTVRPDCLAISIWPWASGRWTSQSSCMHLVRRVWANWLDPELTWDQFAQEWNQWQETNCVCHMPPEANDQFLREVLAALDQGSWPPGDSGPIELMGPQTDYYRPR